MLLHTRIFQKYILRNCNKCEIWILKDHQKWIFREYLKGPQGPRNVDLKQNILKDFKYSSNKFYKGYFKGPQGPS